MATHDQMAINAQMMAREAQLNKIYALYDKLNNQEFTGAYSGEFFGANQRLSTIEPAKDDYLVRARLDDIQQVAQGKVWKGFTNYQDSTVGLPWDFRFFVNLKPEVIQSTTKFRITGYKTFLTTNVKYTLGVGIDLAISPIFVQPIFVQQLDM